jgi:hypothetical protein
MGCSQPFISIEFATKSRKSSVFVDATTCTASLPNILYIFLLHAVRRFPADARVWLQFARNLVEVGKAEMAVRLLLHFVLGLQNEYIPSYLFFFIILSFLFLLSMRPVFEISRKIFA